MSVAAVAAVALVEYQVADGTVLKLHVSPEVAAALRQAERPLKERCATDVRVRYRDRPAEALDLARVDPRRASWRLAQRFVPLGSPWEGPRPHFALFRGLELVGWHGHEVFDAAGR